MDFLESLRMSWRSIGNHRLRSGLTALGIIIGIGAVITFVTLGTSLEAGIVGDLSGGNSPEIDVSVGLAQGGEPPGGGPGQDSSAIPVFTEHDIDRVRALDGVEGVVPSGTVSTTALEYQNQSVAWESATATTPGFFDSRTFAAGGAFAQGEPQAVLNGPAATVFEGNVSVGDQLTLATDSGRQTVTVVGVLNESGTGGAAFGPDGTTPQVYVPTDPLYETTVASPTTGAQQRAYPELTVVAAEYDRVDAVATSVETYLVDESDATTLAAGTYSFSVQTDQEQVNQIQTVINTFTGFVTGIALLSLVVGSIGIANIMLVSATERTREIGIMKAIGGQKRDVLQLFLVEAVLLGIIGSIVGTGVGVLGGYAVATLIGLSVAFALEWVAIAIGVGVLVGVGAGLYPAWNAARIDPIDALRYE